MDIIFRNCFLSTLVFTYSNANNSLIFTRDLYSSCAAHAWSNS